MILRKAHVPSIGWYTATATLFRFTFFLSLLFSGCGGANVPVTSNPIPTVSITANAASVTSGTSVTLIVTSTNSTQVVVTGTDGSSYKLPANGGTQIVSPTATTTYSVVATGPGGNSAASATVTVYPVPIVTITANPGSIAPGGSSIITVTATNATQVKVTGSDGSSYTLTSSGGTMQISPTATTTYTAAASEVGTTISASVTVTVYSAPTVTINASPNSIISKSSSTLTVAATNATKVTVTGSDGSSYTLQATGGGQVVYPAATTTYTVAATGIGGNTSASAIVTVKNIPDPVNHVIFMLQENHTFDNYFGMLNPYRQSNGWNIGDDGKEYQVDGIEDKLTKLGNKDDEGTYYAPFKLATTCIEDNSSAWPESYGDVNIYDHSTSRSILMDGFVHNTEGFAKNCALVGTCSGTYPDLTGRSAMGYYDEDFFNYFYYMASQFAVSDRWFSPLSGNSAPNRIATFTGGTTQGLAWGPTAQVDIPNIFQELDQANVSWKIYYTVTQGFCFDADECTGSTAKYPSTTFTHLSYSFQYLFENPSLGPCKAPTQSSSAVGDSSNSFCIDTAHIVPLSQYFTDLTSGTLPSFAFIEAGYGNNDEHPGSGQSVLAGQVQVASIMNALMASSEWKDSVFFLSYDEGGGPYDHVPPVPGHSNDYTDASLGEIPDISTIAVNPDGYNPCFPAGGVPTLHCDLKTNDPGVVSGDAPAVYGFAAQLGFRVPNMVVSPFTKRHYVSHTPMDHTAVIKFVENRFIGASAHLTARDAAQPDLLEFFDFSNPPWAAQPNPLPYPVTPTSLGYDPCSAASLGP